MVPRKEVYDTYWYFAAERQKIFFNKYKGLPSPWTQDPILQQHKFCNTYRASDRVSQYLIRHVIYEGVQEEEEVLFRILLFKLFNKIETWEYLEKQLGTITTKNFSFETYDLLLQDQLQVGNPIYTSAYMSCANKAFGYDFKHQNHLSLLKRMVFEDKLIEKVMQTKNLEELFLTLRPYPLLGDFMAYQLATDINYSEIVDFDEKEFTVVGPGSQRGIHKCFSDLGGKSYTEVIRWMQEHQEEEFHRLGLTFQSLWGRPLQLIDCQGLFCETDKYARAKFPELKSNRKKIKAQYVADTKPLPLFYPPKWGLKM